MRARAVVLIIDCTENYMSRSQNVPRKDVRSLDRSRVLQYRCDENTDTSLVTVVVAHASTIST